MIQQPLALGIGWKEWGAKDQDNTHLMNYSTQWFSSLVSVLDKIT